MAENKTKTESKSKDDNAMTGYIDLMIGSDGAFTFHGFGKLDGITIELPDKAINALAPALMSYIWQKKYWFPTHFTQKQRKALSAIAFGDIEMIVAGYREDGRRYREATELSKKLVEHDPKGFEAIREAVSAIKGSDGKVDPDMATPTLYMLLNQFIKRHTDVIGRKPDDLDMHFLRLPLTKKILVGEFIDDEFYECQEGSDDDTDLGLRDLERLLPVVCTTEELSRVLRIPVGTLGWMRYAGRGPRFVRAGNRVRYMRRDVLAWVQRGGE